jgi:hypothetical protein
MPGTRRRAGAQLPTRGAPSRGGGGGGPPAPLSTHTPRSSSHATSPPGGGGQSESWVHFGAQCASEQVHPTEPGGQRSTHSASLLHDGGPLCSPPPGPPPNGIPGPPPGATRAFTLTVSCALATSPSEPSLAPLQPIAQTPRAPARADQGAARWEDRVSAEAPTAWAHPSRHDADGVHVPAFGADSSAESRIWACEPRRCHARRRVILTGSRSPSGSRRRSRARRTPIAGAGRGRRGAGRARLT